MSRIATSKTARRSHADALHATKTKQATKAQQKQPQLSAAIGMRRAPRPSATMSRFVDAPQHERCAATITLRDGSTAQCGRRATDGARCWQHAAPRPSAASVRVDTHRIMGGAMHAAEQMSTDALTSATRIMMGEVARVVVACELNIDPAQALTQSQRDKLSTTADEMRRFADRLDAIAFN